MVTTTPAMTMVNGLWLPPLQQWAYLLRPPVGYPLCFLSAIHHFPWLVGSMSLSITTTSTLCVFSPQFVIIFHGLSSERIYYNDYQYPVWADTLGWLMMTFTIVPIPLLMIISFGRHVGSFKVKSFIHSLFTSSQSVNRSLYIVYS